MSFYRVRKKFGGSLGEPPTYREFTTGDVIEVPPTARIDRLVENRFLTPIPPPSVGDAVAAEKASRRGGGR